MRGRAGHDRPLARSRRAGLTDAAAVESAAGARARPRWRRSAASRSRRAPAGLARRRREACGSRALVERRARSSARGAISTSSSSSIASTRRSRELGAASARGRRCRPTARRPPLRAPLRGQPRPLGLRLRAPTSATSTRRRSPPSRPRRSAARSSSAARTAPSPHCSPRAASPSLAVDFSRRRARARGGARATRQRRAARRRASPTRRRRATGISSSARRSSTTSTPAAAAADRALAARRSSEHGACVLAVSWRGRGRDEPMRGDDVHDLLAAELAAGTRSTRRRPAFASTASMASVRTERIVIVGGGPGRPRDARAATATRGGARRA